jgi:hypothetical protein
MTEYANQQDAQKGIGAFLEKRMAVVLRAAAGRHLGRGRGTSSGASALRSGMPKAIGPKWHRPTTLRQEV